jgi:predicted dehydrogenase
MAPFLEAVDAVYVATPPDQHLPAIRAALAARRPVLCEKPFTTALKDTEEVIARAQDTGVAVMEAVWTLALPAYQALKRRLDKLSGSPAHRMTFDFSYPLLAAGDAHFLDPARGGVLLDRAVYGYAAAISLLGPVQRQDVFVGRDATGLDRSAEMRLLHESGATALLTLSFDHLGANRLDLATAQGLACLGPSSLAAEVLRWEPFSPPGAGANQGKGRLQGLKTRPALRRIKQRLQAMKGEFLPYGASPYGPVLEEFQRVVASGAGQSELVPLRMSGQIAALTAEARRR